MDRRFNGQTILKAISDLFGDSSGYVDGFQVRRQADALLRDFSKADCIPVSFELLRSHVCGQTRLPESALQLLATGQPLHLGIEEFHISSCNTSCFSPAFL